MKFTTAVLGLTISTKALALCPYAARALEDPKFVAEHIQKRDAPKTDEEHEKRQSGPGGLPFTTFNEDQLIDVTGDHAWVAPRPNDIRGPCLASTHLPTMATFPTAAWFPLSSPPLLLRRFTTTTSIMEMSRLKVDRFEALYNLQRNAAVPNYDLDTLTTHRKYTFDNSLDTNPYFFWPPFAGIAVSNAAHTFIPALMSNHSAEYPNGILKKETLKSFFAINEAADGT
ncbi:MAG: hypothetical protein OHK93_006291 [Ramalina farinacea]|uniref:Heme haloperoxidase family profile domain-containing protein n=1 Tax=Ramalina farinacea TaxID=258253 RepID=A0AA43QLR2_9LECA|nr:hypothetical protein [Ramalina farinacea]